MVRTITITNFCDYPIWINARSADDVIGAAWNKKNFGETFQFSFTPNIFGVTHFWGAINAPNKAIPNFPIYNEGAPNGDNNFCVYDSGLFLGAEKIRVWERR